MDYLTPAPTVNTQGSSDPPNHHLERGAARDGQVTSEESHSTAPPPTREVTVPPRKGDASEPTKAHLSVQQLPESHDKQAERGGAPRHRPHQTERHEDPPNPSPEDRESDNANKHDPEKEATHPTKRGGTHQRQQRKRKKSRRAQTNPSVDAQKPPRVHGMQESHASNTHKEQRGEASAAEGQQQQHKKKPQYKQPGPNSSTSNHVEEGIRIQKRQRELELPLNKQHPRVTMADGSTQQFYVMPPAGHTVPTQPYGQRVYLDAPPANAHPWAPPFHQTTPIQQQPLFASNGHFGPHTQKRNPAEEGHHQKGTQRPRSHKERHAHHAPNAGELDNSLKSAIGVLQHTSKVLQMSLRGGPRAHKSAEAKSGNNRSGGKQHDRKGKQPQSSSNKKAPKTKPKRTPKPKPPPSPTRAVTIKITGVKKHSEKKSERDALQCITARVARVIYAWYVWTSNGLFATIGYTKKDGDAELDCIELAENLEHCLSFTGKQQEDITCNTFSAGGAAFCDLFEKAKIKAFQDIAHRTAPVPEQTANMEAKLEALCKDNTITRSTAFQVNRMDADSPWTAKQATSHFLKKLAIHYSRLDKSSPSQSVPPSDAHESSGNVAPKDDDDQRDAADAAELATVTTTTPST